MSDVDLTTPVGQYVIERPTRARVFEQLGIDYCCGGKELLGSACEKRGLDPRAGTSHGKGGAGPLSDDPRPKIPA